MVDINTRKATTGILAYVTCHLVDWYSKNQYKITHLTAEYEYVAVGSATGIIIWFRCLMVDLQNAQAGIKVIQEDNQACIVLERGDGRFLTSKRVSIRYQYLREKVLSDEIVLNYMPKDEQLVDLLTKPLITKRFE